MRAGRLAGWPAVRPAGWPAGRLSGRPAGLFDDTLARSTLACKEHIKPIIMTMHIIAAAAIFWEITIAYNAC